MLIVGKAHSKAHRIARTRTSTRNEWYFFIFCLSICAVPRSGLPPWPRSSKGETLSFLENSLSAVEDLSQHFLWPVVTRHICFDEHPLPLCGRIELESGSAAVQVEERFFFSSFPLFLYLYCISLLMRETAVSREVQLI